MGISFCDDPFDPYRSQGIYDSDTDTNIPMNMNGFFCTMMTHCPSLDKIESCRHIILSDEHHWDPTSEIVDISSIYTSIPKPLTSMSTIYKFDTLMSSCGLSTEELIHQTAASVSVSSNTKSMDQRLASADKKYWKPTPFPELLQHDAMFISERHHKVTAESLARKFHIGIKRALHTINVMTQEAIRSALHPLTRRYKTDFMQSKYHRLNTTFFTDTIFPTIKSLNQYTCAQVWANAEGYVYVDPLRSKKDTHISLNHLVEDIGVPRQIFSDGAKEETGLGSKFVRWAQELKCNSQWQNRGEGTIGKLKA